MLPVLVLAAVAGLLLSPGLISGPSLDASVFTYVGERVTEGARLYADVWDHKPPGVYYVYAVFQFLLPFLSPWHVTWLVSLLATTLTGAAALVTMRRLGVAPAPALAAAVGIVAATSQYLTALGGGLTEPMATLPACLALALLVAMPVTWLRSLIVGALLGMSLLTSFVLVPAAAAVGGLAVVQTMSGGARVRHLLVGLLGGLVPVVVMVAFLWATDSLASAIDAVFRYAAAYRMSGQAFGAALSGTVAAWTLLAFLFLIVPAAYGAAHSRRASPRFAPVVACCIWIGLALVTFPLQGRFLAHYAIPLAVPLGLLAGAGLDRAYRVPHRAALAPFAIGMGVSLVAGVIAGHMEWTAVDAAHRRSTAVANAVRALSGQDETILVWGNSPQLNLDAHRASAIRYSYLYPLATPGFTSAARVAGAIDELRDGPPVVVVDAGSPAPGAGGFLPLLIDRPVGTDGRTLDLLDPMRDFVREGYEAYGVVEGWVVYVRQPD